MSINIGKIKQIPIKKVVEYLGLKLSQNNKAQCPESLHKNNDKKPSLQIYEETNSWFCFTCGVGGSVIDLVCLVRQCSIAKAIRKLEGLL